MKQSQTNGLDEIDRIILGILSRDPRTPYADIATELEERGFEMSGEGIRYRVQNLFEATSTFFMLDPEAHDWQVLRLSLRTNDSAGAKQAVIEKMQAMPFWFISSGVGLFDVYAVALAKTLGEADEYIDAVRSIEQVTNVEFFLETHRITNMNKYFPIDESA